jgi:UDP-4-amino-4,6-dideoxy-N-acetyl-beta-L-altrosamine transaminase
MDKPALEGGKPVRDTFLPYGKQWITEEDIQKVDEVLRSDWITTGPVLRKFETEFASFVKAKHAIAVSSGTAALHIAVSAAGIGKEDEVITTPMTFAATSNVVVMRGGKPVFADIKNDTFNIDSGEIKKKVTKKTKAIIPVHFTGQPCDLDEIHEIAQENGQIVIEDAAHAVDSEYKGRKVGSISDLSVFSFHPVKNITTGEGGMVTTNNDQLAEQLEMYRNHGINKDANKRFGKEGSWFYEMQHLGLNYRLTDIQAALGLSQLKRISELQDRRRDIVKIYNKELGEIPEISIPHVKDDVKHGWHLYIITIEPEMLKVDRNKIFEALRAENIGVNVHYIPVHLHPYYKDLFGYKEGDYPVSEMIYSKIITLPLFPRMTDDDTFDVINAIKKVVQYYKKD